MRSHLRRSFENPNNVFIDRDCSDLAGIYEEKLFFNCIFKKLNGLTLKNCDLNKSKFITDKIEDALGLTLTLTCLSFNDVELSPLVFDLILCLLLKTAGNTDKRRKIAAVLGKDRLLELLTQMKGLE